MHEASTDGSVQTAPVHTDGTLGFLKQRSIIDAELQLPAIGTISAQPQRRASTRYFFAEHGGSGSALAAADAPAETLAKQLRDAHAYLIRQIELLSAVFLVLGVYDALHFFHTGRLLT